MEKDNILKEFDTLAEAKKKNATNLKLCLGFALIVVILVLVWGFSISLTALNKVVVVERSGEYLKTFSEDKEAQFLTFIKNTCALATHYANTFDRYSLKKNQTRAKCYINTDDANAIFSKYYADKAYSDALLNGAVYKCTLDSVPYISGVNEPYKVRFFSTLIIRGASGNSVKFAIVTEGELIRVTPQFSENVTGFTFNKFIQQMRLIPEETK